MTAAASLRVVCSHADRAALEQLDEAVSIAHGASLTDEERARVAALDLGGDPACDPRTW